MVSLGRPRANQDKIPLFADWLTTEGVVEPSTDYELNIIEPRHLVRGVGAASEEFMYRQYLGETWVQQYAFNTPYGAPEDAICGRVTFSAFHVSALSGPRGSRDAIFPEHCQRALTQQEKILLYALLDLGACVERAPTEVQR